MPYKNIVLTNAGSVQEASTKRSQFYKGFSSVNTSTSNTRLYDFDLIQQDIINHFNTRRGERVMNPEFGTVIWDLLMEPMTEETKEILLTDISRICNNDPRVTPTQINLTEYETGYLLELTLTLTGTDQSASIRLTFDQSIGLQH